ncbi:MAG: hypothetical protein M3004_01485, partial [Bacteroidota bacterium]|nr:hypothetical protein [Bacteroidota bacterium]
MKKICLLVITSILLFYACNTENGHGPAYAIKMRLNKGDTFTHHIKMAMTTTTGIIEMKMNTDM